MRRTNVLPLIALTALAACMLAGCGTGTSDSREGAAPSAAESGLPSQSAFEREAELQERELELARREAEADRREREALTSHPQASAKPAPAPAIAPADAEPVTTTRPPVRHYPRPAPAAEPAMQTVRVTVRAATALNIELIDPLSSETAQAGDQVRARLVDAVTSDGHQVFPAGSTLTGVVTAAVPSKKIGGQASVSLTFDRIDMPSGESVALRATLFQEGKSQAGKDAATIGGSAAGGALLGRVLKDGKDKDKATAIGAVVGAVVGTAVAAKNKTQPVELEPGTTASLVLEGPVTLAVRTASPDETYAQR